MRKSVVLLLGTFSLFAGFSHADDGDDDAISAKEVKTLFFGHDDRTRVTDPTESPSMPSGNWKPPAAIYVLQPSLRHALR